jgi:hypothetical protein
MNFYCTLEQLRGRLNLPAGTREELDTQMGAILEDVSRQIDVATHRHFFVVTATRPFTYCGTSRYSSNPRLAPLDLGADLLRIAEDGLRTDPTGDRSYGTTWAVTDYDLLPSDAPYQSPPAPYTRIATRRGGQYSFSTYPLGVQIAGEWGYYDVRVRLTATVATDGIDESATTLPVTALGEFGVGQTLRLEDEQCFVTELVTTAGEDEDPDTYSLAVVRAVNGTEAADHAEETAIDLYTYPGISERCLEQSKRRYERSIGRAGRETEPGIRNFGNLDRDIEEGLADFTRWGIH